MVSNYEPHLIHEKAEAQRNKLLKFIHVNNEPRQNVSRIHPNTAGHYTVHYPQCIYFMTERYSAYLINLFSQGSCKV